MEIQHNRAPHPKLTMPITQEELSLMGSFDGQVEPRLVTAAHAWGLPLLRSAMNRIRKHQSNRNRMPERPARGW